MGWAKVATLGLLVAGAAVGTLVAAPIPVRFAEGVTHGFLLLRSLDGALLATGDLLQVVRGGEVEKRTVFQFQDRSTFDESVVFTQQGVYVMKSYRLRQSGPRFDEELEVTLERAGSKYRVKTTNHEGGGERTLQGTLELPSDVYNGMIPTVVKDLPKGAGETVHYVAFTPEPRLIQLQLTPAGEQPVLVGALAKTAVRYAVKPQLGTWATLFAKLLGRMPPDQHLWILPDDAPAFVRFEGPLYPTGPVWRIELTSPRWPE